MTLDTINKRIYYHDTDCGGVVYYGNYLKYCEEGRSEYLRHRGITLSALAKEGIYFVVTCADIQYKSPARYGDEITVCTKLEKTKAASLEFYQQISRDKTTLVQCRTKMACINQEFAPQPIPSEIALLFSEKIV